MTLDELRVMAEKAIADAPRLCISRPIVILVLPRDCRGRRAKVMPGLMGNVRATEYGPDGRSVRTIVEVDAHSVLRVLSRAPVEECRHAATVGHDEGKGEVPA